MSPGKFIEIISKTFMSYINKGVIEKHPAVFVHGQPGIGKSQSINKLAKLIEEASKKTVNIIDIRLLLFNPIDLRGIPIANKEEKKAVWLKPEIFDLVYSSDVINILFLDELTSAPVSVQTAAYQLALDRKIGEYALPNNTFLIAAGNRIIDNAVVYEMPSALKNRFIHFELEVDLHDWLKWANETGINKEIIQFLKENPSKFVDTDFETESNIIVTPRSWEMLSNLLNVVGGSIEDNIDLVASVVGTYLANLMIRPPLKIDFTDIINGKATNVPTENDELIRVIELLETNITKFIDDETKTENVLKYLNILPVDYALRVFRKMITKSVTTYNLQDLNEYKNFINKLNGIIDE